MNITTASNRGDSIAPYANVFLRQGTDTLLVALRNMSRYVPLAGWSIISRFKLSILILTFLFCLGSLMRDLDLEDRRMAPIIAPRYSKELHLISDLEHRQCTVVH